MRVHDHSTNRRQEFTIQINWSRPSAFSERQRFWIDENIPDVLGVYVMYMRDHRYSFQRRRTTPIIYFGSGWVRNRLLFHLTADDDRRNPEICRHLDEVPLAFRWAEIQFEGQEDWPVVAEAILAYEFERVFGELPPANRIRPPARPEFDASYINQHPIDVIDDL